MTRPVQRGHCAGRGVALWDISSPSPYASHRLRPSVAREGQILAESAVSLPAVIFRRFLSFSFFFSSSSHHQHNKKKGNVKARQL